MQIEIINIIYLFLISGVALFLINFFNRKYIFRHRKCLNIREQVKHKSIVDNQIDIKIVEELYQTISKYFNIKSCLLDPCDKIKIFYDISSFNLHEDYEDFVDYVKKEFHITVDLNDELIDLMVNIKQSRKFKI